MEKKKTVKETRTEQVYFVRQTHINGYGRLFGGQLMSWIDQMAGIVGKRHAENPLTTACVDQLNFIAPAHMGDVLVLVGQMAYVGRSSMEVRVDTYIESLHGERKLINTAYVVMVAIDPEGKAVEVPALICETEEEKQEWANGEKRYQLRKLRRKEGF